MYGCIIGRSSSAKSNRQKVFLGIQSWRARYRIEVESTEYALLRVKGA